MDTKKDAKKEGPSVLDVVALLMDLPPQRLTRGQVGTIVELLDNETLLGSSATTKALLTLLHRVRSLTCWFYTTFPGAPELRTGLSLNTMKV